MNKLVILSLFCCSCAGSLEVAKQDGRLERVSGDYLHAEYGTPERCAQLDNQYRMWGGVAKGAAMLSGTTGISTIPTHDDKTLQTSMAISSVAFGATAAFAVFLSQSASESWSRECGTAP